MSERPTLHEIAAMPFPRSEQALLRYYGVTPWRERPAGGLKTFEVTIEYSERVTDSVSYKVEAVDEEHAERLADELFDDDKTVPADVDVDSVDVSEIDA